MKNFLNALNSWLGDLGYYALHTLLPALLIFVIGVVIIRAVVGLLNKMLGRSKLEKAAHSLIRTTVRATLYILLALIVASSMGIDVTGVIALASVLTLAVSLSVQAALTNVISGFTLLYTKPFSSGDFVEIAGQSGSVQEIGLTYTKLVTPDNKIASIPNGAVTSAQIVNYTVLGKRRVDVEVSASYECAVSQVLEALKEAGKVEGILEEDGIFAAVDRYGESSIAYALRVWCKSESYFDVKFAINEKVKAVFDEKGLAMTYPHLNVHLDK